MKARYLSVVVLALATCGCGIAAKVHARDDMMQAKTEYTQCLQENSVEPAKCAGYKEAYEADLQAYRATSAGVQPGYALSVNESPD
jgi:hypothetical protein